MSAIRNAEKQTSGEIRVHIDNKCPKPVLEQAYEIFMRLGMSETEAKNGVLIYLSLDDRKVAIIGDSGIDGCVEANFWEDVKERMIDFFRKGHITEGICDAIGLTGEKLKIHFPYRDDDKNELSDEISFEK